MVDAVIETARLILRPPQDADLDWQLAWLNTPAVTRHLGGVRGSQAFAKGFASNVAAFSAGEPGFFTLLSRSDGEVVGKCGLSRIDGGPAPAEMHGEIQVGWSLAEPFWGKGLAAEAARAAIRHSFDCFGVATVWSQTSDSNGASTRLMQRLGLIRRADLDYFDPDYPAADNPTTVYMTRRSTGRPRA